MEVDVVIIGAGPAGCAASITLAEAGARVALLGRPGVAEGRGEDLSPAGPGLLAQLGVWERVRSDGHLPCFAQVSVWGRATPQWYDFLRDPRGHGFHLDRTRLESRLRERSEQAGVMRFGPEIIRGHRDRDGWTFPAVEGGGPVHSRYVMDASGRASSFARRQGARREDVWRQVALVGWVTTTRPIEETFTLVESVPEGFWYSAPMPGGRFALALFTESTFAAGSMAGPPQTLGEHLTRATHTKARFARHGGEWAATPRRVDAGCAKLNRSQGPGWIAAGDAALSYDPVSAHGLTLALRTGIDAATALLADAAGDVTAFPQYQQRLDRAFAIHCHEALRLYGEEWRWPDATYWKNRQVLENGHPGRRPVADLAATMH